MGSSIPFNLLLVILSLAILSCAWPFPTTNDWAHSNTGLVGKHGIPSLFHLHFSKDFLFYYQLLLTGSLLISTSILQFSCPSPPHLTHTQPVLPLQLLRSLPFKLSSILGLWSAQDAPSRQWGPSSCAGTWCRVWSVGFDSCGAGMCFVD
jgi:hypothetical protein